MSTRAHMTETDKAEVWRRRARGEPVPMIARHMGRDRGTVWKVVTATGGIPPRTPQRSWRELRVGEREELSRGLAMGESCRAIARRLGRAASTVSREVHRNGGRQSYRAAAADGAVVGRRRRPKPGKLALSSALRAEVEAGLQLDWSPKQISAWLKREYSDNPQMQISHETIYVSLYVQGRGSLRAELTKHLRTRRTYRRAKNEIRRQGPKMLPDPIMISERPAEANDRAVPGHWEGDLLLGTPTTAIGTLVERSTRYVMLFTLARGPRAQAVREGIATSIVKLPLSLRRSLTWDQGAEMSQHQRFTVETGVAIYFCDPGHPWQRGTNENTNGLLRQYFPKGRTLAHVTQAELDRVADQLNGRPRETLGWRTPAEALTELLKQSASS
ncbi:MAG: IS30 family transposase [Chloroflexi bacterium]|nr:MAG: IS30 family transposase [Chloroflexota bacterium]